MQYDRGAVTKSTCGIKAGKPPYGKGVAAEVRRPVATGTVLVFCRICKILSHILKNNMCGELS